MAFTVNFYQFNKQENSTVRPSGTPESFQCIIKHGSGIISPTIELDIGLTEAPLWNYCYIPAWRRYYYISEWYFDKAIWRASLNIDVLATYRAEIGSEYLYALRTSVASLYDGRIPDELYPTKAGCDYSSNTITGLWTLTGGMYATGVINKHADFGSLKYYLFDSNQFSTIVSYLLSDQLMTDYQFSTQDATFELQKALIDPLQYIKSCVYIPVPKATIKSEFGYMETISIFNWDIWKTTETVLASVVTPSKPRLSFTRTVAIPKHPQTNSRGNYTNQKPYTSLNLLIPPFGLIEIDTTVTCNAKNLEMEVSIDMLTGLGIVTITCNNIILNRIEAQIGVPVQLSQISRDYLGGATSLIGGAVGTIGSIMTGDAGGAIMSATTGIGNAARALTPRSQTIGSGGAYAQLDYIPKLEAQFFEVVDDDIEKNGRPCCKIVQCGNNSGYYLIQDGDVSISGTQEEASQIKNYLETGFYYE